MAKLPRADTTPGKYVTFHLSSSLPGASRALALAQVAHRRPLPSFAPFAVLCYSSKLPGPPSFTTTFLRTVELQRKTSLPFMRFFMRLLLSIHRSGWIIGRNREREKWTFYAKYIDRKNFVARSERIPSPSSKRVRILDPLKNLFALVHFLLDLSEQFQYCVFYCMTQNTSFLCCMHWLKEILKI